MTTAATYYKLTQLAAASSGIVTSSTGIPGQMPEDSLPHVVTIVGPGSWNEHASGLYRSVRTYEQRVFVQPIRQGDTPDSGYSNCLPILYALGRTYNENQDLDGTIDGLVNGEFRDGGVAVMEWAGIPYHGFVITLNVIEKAT